MKNRKVLIALIIALVAIITATIVIIAVTNKEEPDPIIPEGPETGTYCCYTDAGDYSIKLHSGNKFALTVDGEKTGVYTVEGETLTLDFDEDADGVITGTIANNTVAIVMANPIAKDMSDEYGISPQRTACLLDTFSCIFQGVIPYGAQMLVAVSAAAEMGQNISAFDIMTYLFYPYLLLVCSLISIFFTKKK